MSEMTDMRKKKEEEEKQMIPNATPVTHDGPKEERDEVILSRGHPWTVPQGANAFGHFGSLFVGIVLVALFFCQIVVMAITFARTSMSGAMESREYECEAGGSFEHVGYDLQDYVKEDMCSCRADHSITTRRVLDSDGDSKVMTMFDLMAEHIYVPLVGFFSVFVIAIAWLALLGKFGTSFVIVNLIATIAIFLVLGGLLMAEGVVGFAIVFFLVGFAIASYCCFRRVMVLRAGRTMETAARGLQKNAGVFATLIPIEIIFVVYIFVLIEALVASFFVYKVEWNSESHECQILMEDTQLFKSLLVTLWIAFYLHHVKVNVVGASLSYWAFGQRSDQVGGMCGSVAVKALGWSFWSSWPTLSVSSLFVTIVERIKKTVNNKINYVNPCCWCFLLVFHFLMNQLQAYGRFLVVVHSITGKPFLEAASKSFDLLVKGGNLEHAISANYFAEVSLELTSYVLSFGVGMLMWIWIDHAEDLDSFSTDTNTEEESWKVWFYVFLVCWIILNKYPYFLIWLIALIGNSESFAEDNESKSSAMLFGMFVGAIAHIIFDFFASIVLDAVDTMVICYAVDKANGVHTPGADVVRVKEVAAMYGEIDLMVADLKSGKVVPAAADTDLTHTTN